MAVTYTQGDEVFLNNASSGGTGTLTPSGSEGGVAAAMSWRGTPTITSVKHGTTDMNAETGATADETSGGGVSSIYSRGYSLAVGASAAAVNVVMSTLCVGVLGAALADGVDQTTPAHSGFGQHNFVGTSAGTSDRNLTLTQSSIATDTDELLAYFGFGYCSPGSTMSGVSSTTGSEIDQDLSGVYGGALYQDTGDSTSETAAITFTAPAYYSGSPFFAWYTPNMRAVMVGMALQPAAGGGPSAQTLAPGAISSLEVFGSHSVINQLQFLTPGSIASAEAFGAHTLSPGVVNVSPGSITSAEAFGDATLTGVVTITPSGVASLEAFGSHTLATGEVFISPSSIASLEAFGDHAVTQAFILAPSSINSLEAFGSGAVITGAVSITPTGIGSAEAFGTHLLSSVIVLTPDGIASLEAFGDGQITLGPVTIEPAGIDSAEAFGLAFVDDGTGQPRARWFIRMRGAIVGTLTVNMTDTVRKH